MFVNKYYLIISVFSSNVRLETIKSCYHFFREKLYFHYIVFGVYLSIEVVLCFILFLFFCFLEVCFVFFLLSFCLFVCWLVFCFCFLFLLLFFFLSFFVLLCCFLGNRLLKISMFIKYGGPKVQEKSYLITSIIWNEDSRTESSHKKSWHNQSMKQFLHTLTSDWIYLPERKHDSNKKIVNWNNGKDHKTLSRKPFTVKYGERRWLFPVKCI